MAPLTINGITFNDDQVTKTEVKHVDGKDVYSVWLDNGTSITYTRQTEENSSVFTNGQTTVIQNVSDSHITGNPNQSDTIVLQGLSDRNTIDTAGWNNEQNFWQKFLGFFGLNNKDADNIVMDSSAKDNAVIVDPEDFVENDVHPLGKPIVPALTSEDGRQVKLYDLVDYPNEALYTENGVYLQESLIKENLGKKAYENYKLEQNLARRGK